MNGSAPDTQLESSIDISLGAWPHRYVGSRTWLNKGLRAGHVGRTLQTAYLCSADMDHGMQREPLQPVGELLCTRVRSGSRYSLALLAMHISPLIDRPYRS